MIAVQFGSGNASGKAVGLRMDLLWENDDLSANFAAQTVQMDLSAYTHYVIVPIFSTSNQNASPAVLNVAQDGIVAGLVVGSGTNNNVGSRTCYYDSSVPGIVFAGGRYGGANNNGYCIPKAVYGVKTGSGSSSGGGGGGGGGSGVASVNGMTGIVILDAADVNAVPSGQGVPSGGSTGQVLAKASGTDHDLVWTTAGGGGAVSSVNGQTGAVVLDAADVGALPDTTTAADLGAYVLPSGGIPKTDLASAVQTSLGKADTALQSYTETDPTVPAWAKAGTKPSYTASEVGAIAAPSSPATGAFLVWNGSAWVAQTLSQWSGGSY